MATLLTTLLVTALATLLATLIDKTQETTVRIVTKDYDSLEKGDAYGDEGL